MGTKSAEYELPEEQAQIDEPNEDQMLAVRNAEDLAVEMDQVKTATRSGILKVPLKRIDSTKTGGSLSIEFDPPAEEGTVTKTMARPKAWSRQYDFVRWVESLGYSAGDLHRMIEDDVDVKVIYEDDEYELVVPPMSRRTRALEWLRGLSLSEDSSFGLYLLVPAVSMFIIVAGLIGLIAGMPEVTWQTTGQISGDPANGPGKMAIISGFLAAMCQLLIMMAVAHLPGDSD